MSDVAVAVVGMACRFPGVGDVEDFWRLLSAGETTVGMFPEARSVRENPRSHPDAVALRSGSFFESVDGFDAAFFGVGAAEAAAMDPVQRLGLELAWEAVEDARMPASALSLHEVDVVVGAASSGYEVLRRSSGADRDDHYAALGSSGALVANRISSLFDVRGLSLSADSGQSSSLVSVALACERIRGGAVDSAIAGGVNVVVDPEDGLGLANLGALSPDGRCFAFDARASGFVRGEGGAFVVLKRLDLALAEGDRVYAVVSGWGVGSAGASTRMPDPSPSAQAATVLSALDSAGVSFDSVDYVEAHGTGTRLGDPAEIAGLREVIQRFGRSRRLAVGSVKTNVGHLESAAGIAGFVKAVLCVDRACLVPSLNFRSPNPAAVDFEQDFEVVRETRPWTGSRRAGVSAFGMGGTNAHVIIERAPHTRVRPRAEVRRHVGTSQAVPWVMSARSEPALREQASRLRDLVVSDPGLSPADVGFSLVSTRSSFEHRGVVIGVSREELLAGLAAVAEGRRGSGEVVSGVATPVGKTVFVFPGQGSQWTGMGRQLYAESEVFARAIDDCAKALAPWVDWSLVDTVCGGPDAGDLQRIDVVQPVLFAIMVSLARLWRSLGVVPDAVVGHSQGEIAAACVAGALSLEDAAKVVALRSLALTELADLGNGMSAVPASPEWVRTRLTSWKGRLSVAAVNGPRSVVISGDDDALDRFAETAGAEGVRVRRIKVDYASHSHHVERIRGRLLADLAGVSSGETAVEFHSTVIDAPRMLDNAYWYANLRSTVRFGEVVENLMSARGDVFVEVSPHPVLQVAMAEVADAISVSPLVVGTSHRDDGGLGAVLGFAAELHVRGVPVHWPAVFSGDRPARVGLPSYPFQRRSYWLSAPDEAEPVRESVAAELESESSVLRLVCAEAAVVLGRRDAGDLLRRAAESFRDLGFDSSMVVRLRNRLGKAAGVRLPATVAFTYPTPQTLGRHIFSHIGAAVPDEPVEPVEPRPELGGDDELYELIDRGYA